MSYLQPPPNFTPVIVMKDTGGLVSEYQARTDLYRITNREVRLHECRSACTLALSLPNVCVYPGSLLKFHLAYNEITRQSDYGVSQQLFQAYPPAVQARLGGLTRQYQTLTGSELIRLGIRDCNMPRPPEPKIMLAKVTPQPVQAMNGGSPDLGLGTMWHKVTGIFGDAMMPSDLAAPHGIPGTDPAMPSLQRMKPADIAPMPMPDAQPWPPEPPARPHELLLPLPGRANPPNPTVPVNSHDDAVIAGLDPVNSHPKAPLYEAPLPPLRPVYQTLFSDKTSLEPKLTQLPWAKLMSGAHQILPARFTAYVKITMR